MEVNIKYSDYNDEVDSAILKLDDFQSVELQNVYEETGVADEEISYLELRYIDKGNGSTVSHKLNKEEIHKYMDLLKLLGRQL